ncbi:MAG TPA: arylesterase [Pyrinomonadaceae bacterium]|nr:arylesterase [Pyrinomonadaceae bacterium]
MRNLLLALLISLAAAASACGDKYPPDGARGSEASSSQPQAGASQTPVAASRQNLPKIVAFGDSLTAGYGLQQSQSYPSLLQAMLDADGYQYEVVNAGVSGDTSAGGVRRLDWALDGGDVRFLVLELGANDHLRGQPVSETRKNLSAIIARARERGVKVLLAGMITTTTRTGDRYEQEIAEMYRAVAKEHNVALLPFFLEGVAGVERLNLQDRVHPNAEGTKIVASNVYRALRPMLDEEQK